MKKAIILSEIDNVATVLEDIASGENIDIINKNNQSENVIVPFENIGRGHKIAVENIDKGLNVVKYGCTIGTASKPIKKGEFVHIHNLESNRGRGDLV